MAIQKRNHMRMITQWSSANPEHALVIEMKKAYDQGGDAAVGEFIQQNILQFEEATNSIFDFPAERELLYAELGGTPHLDGQYTVFGQVVSGLEVIDQIDSVETSSRDKPQEDVVMLVTAEKMRKKKITKLYGYVYED